MVRFKDKRMELAIFCLKRFLYLFITIMIVISVGFLLFRILPDDPTRLYLLKDAQEIISDMHLDDPIIIQYFHYVVERLTGSFDYPSTTYLMSVDIGDYVYGYMLRTLFLMSLVVGFSVLFGTLYGMFAAKARKNSIVDRMISLPALILFCIPVTCTALILIDFTWSNGRLFPLSGHVSDDFADLGFFEKIVDVLYHAFLPVSICVIAVFGMFTLIVKKGIRAFAKDPASLTADGMRMPGRHIVVRSFHGMLPMIKLFVVWSLAVTLVVDFLLGYDGLGELLWVAIRHYWAAAVVDVLFYLIALTAITFMFVLDFAVGFAFRRIDAECEQSPSEVSEPFTGKTVSNAAPLEVVMQKLAHNWTFFLGLGGLICVVIIAAIGPSVVGATFPTSELNVFEWFLLGGKGPLLVVLAVCLVSGAVGMLCGCLIAVVNGRNHFTGRAAGRGLEILGDAMIAISLFPLIFAPFWIFGNRTLGIALTSLVVYIWYWGPIANTVKDSRLRISSTRNHRHITDERTFWYEVVGRTLSATKFVAVIGLLSVTMLEFMDLATFGYISLGGHGYYTWGEMLRNVVSHRLWLIDGWIWLLLPAFGLAFLAGSVYVIIGEIEKVFNVGAKT